MTTFDAHTTAESAASVLQNEIRGKNVLVTGVSPNSLGAETVRVLAPYAKTIILANRTKSKLDETVAAVLAETPSASLKSVSLDLSSIESIKSAAATINSFGIPLHVIVNNAASPQYETLVRTVDGFEGQLMTNHLGHFLLNSLILPSIRLAAKEDPAYPARIVAVSSLAHAFGEVRFDDPSFEKRPEEYNKWSGYTQSKTANLLYARSIAKKFAAENIIAFSLHPGAIRETTMGSVASDAELKAFGLLKEDGTPISPNPFRTIPEGTATQVVASFDPTLKAHSGSYLADCVILDDTVPDYAKNEDYAEKLWVLSEELLKHKFV